MARGRSTIYAVAERAGVSTATVSRVLRGTANVVDATRDRVLTAATELRYLPSGAASHLASRSAADLGLVLPHIDGQYYADLLVGFEAEAGDLGYAVGLVLANPRSNADAAVTALAERCQGLAFMARSSVSDRTVADLARARAAVTVARGTVPGIESFVTENRVRAARLVGHLLDTGRRLPVFAGHVEPGSDLAERHAGFVDAHRARGQEPAPVWTCSLDEAGGDDVARRFLDAADRPDALVCGNDLVALAATRSLARAGVTTPDDLAVTGWDDIHAARYVTPGLTTVRQPVVELGRAAARRLHELITSDPVGTDEPVGEIVPTVWPTEIVHRGSCCAGAGPIDDLMTEPTTDEENR